MIWEARVCVVELGRRRGRRPGARWRRSATSGSPAAAAGGAGHHLQGRHVLVEQDVVGVRRGRRRPSAPRSPDHRAPEKAGCSVCQIFGDWIFRHLVVVEVELVSNTEPVSTLLASKALEVINVRSCTHHHLKGGDHLRVREG